MSDVGFISAGKHTIGYGSNGRKPKAELDWIA